VSQRALIGAGIAVVVAVTLLFGSFYTVPQTQQALILQFGEPVRVVRDPGLHVKLPFIQQAEYFDRRVLDYDAPSVELVLGDQKRLVVDTFARYRISNPLRFRQSIGSEVAFRSRISPIVSSALRSVLGEVSLFTVLSKDRGALMERIKKEANKALVQFGVEVVDIRIKRADLPPENSQAIFKRMQSERDREAKELRAQGAEIGQRIRARADRERRVLIADAQRQADITRGDGEAQAIRIFADAYGKDVPFFDFYRSLQAYRSAFSAGSTSLVLSPDSEFLRFFNNAFEPLQPSGAAPAASSGGSEAPLPPAGPASSTGAGPGAAAPTAPVAPKAD
jgi:membrane protease subunit HflC